jgi:hypothetical protein
VHPPVGQVGDEPGHIELPRNLERRIPEAHPLNPSGKMRDLVVNLRHGVRRLWRWALALQYAICRPVRRGARGMNLFAKPATSADGRLQQMSDFDSDNLSENEWEENGDLAWNEFDWEVYLREQEGSVNRYLGFYESLNPGPDRIDEVADKMGWDRVDVEEVEDRDNPDKVLFSDEIYTLQKNPVYIATKALFLSLRRRWESIASSPGKVPQPLAIAFLSALHGCEEQAVMAVHALDFGDYTMAICLFKRALSQLNGCFAQIGSEAADASPLVRASRDDLRQRLFDIREIWLRVISDCREDTGRHAEDEG